MKLKDQPLHEKLNLMKFPYLVLLQAANVSIRWNETFLSNSNKNDIYNSLNSISKSIYSEAFPNKNVPHYFGQ